MRNISLGTALLALMSVATPASATIIDIIYDFKVTGNSIDGAGIFGAAGGNLAGKAVKVEFKFDTAGAWWYLQAPKPWLMVAASSATATTTINGKSITFTGTQQNYDIYQWRKRLRAELLHSYRSEGGGRLRLRRGSGDRESADIA
jgi:hypothetical protein